MIRLKRATFVALVLVTGCGGGGGSRADHSSASETGGADSTSDPDEGGPAELPACDTGTQGCPCDRDDFCNIGLTCESDVCVPTGGMLGQACFANRTCLPGGLCQDGECIACSAGTAGCDCMTNGTCVAGLACRSGICQADEPIHDPAPENPACYVPCRQGTMLEDGTFAECSSEGLLAGCLEGQQCVGGSCVDDGEDPPECASDIDCPDYQGCIDNQCVSNCEYDSECGGGRKCHRKVCRTTCDSLEEEPCPSGTYCSVLDGERGFCMPLADPGTDADPARVVEGSFELTPDSLRFTDTQATLQIEIENTAKHAVTFTVSKKAHVEYDGAGSKEVTEEPLPWLEIGEPGSTNKVDSLEIEVLAESAATVEIRSAGDDMPRLWDGTLEVSNETLGTRELRLTYSSGGDGRWAGKIYYFSQFGDKNLGTPNVGNAFLRMWQSFENDKLTLDEFEAVVQATITGSWSWASTQRACAEAHPGHEACYLFTSDAGVNPFSNDLDAAPVPSGVVELPIALDLQTSDDPRHLVGRIVTDRALQYPGDPSLDLFFAEDPTDRSECSGGACLARLSALAGHATLGGRYAAELGAMGPEPCSDEYELVAFPWLLPGFTKGTYQENGVRYFAECRHDAVPFVSGDEAARALNQSLTAGNPIPDGRPRERTLSLVTGALVNQEQLLVVFQETFPGEFLGADAPEFAAYGLMMLRRSPDDLVDEDFVGNPPPTVDGAVHAVDDAVTCAPETMETVFPGESLRPESLDEDQVSYLVRTLLDGSATSQDVVDPADVHYLCNGNFDGACPSGHRATYFTIEADVAPSAADCNQPVTPVVDLGDGHCLHNGTTIECPETTAPDGELVLQEAGSCDLTGALNDAWVVSTQLDWTCDAQDSYCDVSSPNPLDHRTFYRLEEEVRPFSSLRAGISSAFAYRVQFGSRDHSSTVGFAPKTCEPGRAYCYDPAAIEKLRDRIDCLFWVHRNKMSHLVATDLDERVIDELRLALSYEQDDSLPPVVRDGFEKLNAELLVMLGDEAYTQAFQARFDLAGMNTRSFEGTRFEPGGINLSGIAGYELYSLYQAGQYYQQVLDRFYSLSPFIWRDLDTARSNPQQSYVSQEVVTSYLGRVLRASSQKSRVWSEVGRRYQAINRPDLARLAVQRAYSSAYLESVVIARMMRLVQDVSPAQNQAQIRAVLDQSALTYRASLLDMEEVYRSFTDSVTMFGFAPDYIPFPLVDGDTANAMDVALGAAEQAMADAKEKEARALSSSRSYNTDSVQFQAELSKISNNYEGQLSELCGTMRADNPADLRVYPAIAQYADVNETARRLQDPCGRLETGAIYEATKAVELAHFDVRAASTTVDNLIESIEIEGRRIDDVCDELDSLSKLKVSDADQASDINEAIGQLRAGQQLSERLAEAAAQLVTGFGLQETGPGGTNTIAFQAPVAFGIRAGSAAVSYTYDELVLASERDLASLQRDGIVDDFDSQCRMREIDSVAKIEELWLQVKSAELQMFKAVRAMELQMSRVSQLRNQATRLTAEQGETEQYAIDLEAARNDPNVRIYKNDAVLSAERSFDAALAEAYKATRVFEYYTSQSYAERDDLSLVRMVVYGDYSLDSYLAELRQAYGEFRESYGKPDVRIDILSVRDDILNIPRYDRAGHVLTQAERVERFRSALQDPSLLDGQGYRVLPFATTLTRMSPLTRNHKILWVEAEVIGADVGDTLGRLYLVQRGTGLVRSVDDEKQYYRLPSRTAVVDPFFNGARPLAGEVYRNDRLRDRPVVNTGWELVLNQRDEEVNQDINLASLTDIRLHVYYTDFTTY